MCACSASPTVYVKIFFGLSMGQIGTDLCVPSNRN